GGVLVIAGGRAPPGLDLVDAALGGVALAVEAGVAGEGAPAPRALPLAVRRLVPWSADHGLDAAPAQVGAVGRRGVGLVGGDGPGPGAGPAGRAADPDLVQDGDEPGAVFGLPGGDDDGQGPAGGVDREMDLGGEAAPGAARGRGRQAGSAAPP